MGSGLSTEAEGRRAALEAAMAARERGPGEPPSLALVFASPHHIGRVADVLDAVREAVGPVPLIGCVGEAILGGPREVEGAPAVAAWLGWFPGSVETFRLEFDPGGGGFTGWPEGEGTHVVLADPFTFPADALLEELEERRPGTLVIGGMASGASGPGETRLFLGDRVLDSGAVGARLPGDLRVRTVVSQGCRPVGPAYTVTKARGNVLEELAGRPALARLRETVATLDERDRGLVMRGLHVGRVIDEYRPEFERGDFLIRGVIGADRETGAIAVGDHIGVGETVRFHVRDAESAHEDLRTLLSTLESDPAGALLFTCNGRGSRMFAVPDHDAALVSKELGMPPVAGFFCVGELGPVGSRNFLHGFTASLAVFYD